METGVIFQNLIRYLNLNKTFLIDLNLIIKLSPKSISDKYFFKLQTCYQPGLYLIVSVNLNVMNYSR